jgi:hypothetical protein
MKLSLHALSMIAAAAAFATEPIPERPKMTADLPSPEATEIWSPEPPVVTVPQGGVPSDAIVLFDGKSLDAWESVAKPGEPAPWKLNEGYFETVGKAGDIRTKQRFGDIQLHIEWHSPTLVKGSSQGRGNSGIFFMCLYELQVLDSYDNKTYVNGQAGAVYKQTPPLVNAARKPGEWQTYDAVWIAPRFAPDGKLLRPARITVFHNGVLVQYNTEVLGPTTNRGKFPYTAHADKLPIMLQDHGNPVAYRNIWVRELKLPEQK